MSEQAQRAYSWGRVASLPFAIVLELCGRLHRGDNTTEILTWLNAFANGTQNRMYRFGRRPISSGSLLKFKQMVYPIYQRHLEQISRDTAGLPTGAALQSSRRVGKIARLPHEIRNEICRRLVAGHTGRSVVSWLNTQQPVIEKMKGCFGGRLVTEENLSQWRIRSIKNYLREQEGKQHG